MKTPFTKNPGIVDEETVRDDEIDELSGDHEDETTTIETADEDSAVDEPTGEASSTEAEQQIGVLQTQLQEATDARIRALADYQNLQRRSQADRAAWSKLATQGLLSSLLEPLEHLQLAAKQLNDPGLSMVVKQLFAQLEEHGLKKIDALGKSFDVDQMEAIAGSDPEGKKVTAVVREGYTLNGVLIQPAKVQIK